MNDAGYTQLREHVAAAAAACDARGPVDRALANVAQRQSYVRGSLARPAEWQFGDDASVLAAEVQRLRRLLGPAAAVESDGAAR